MRSTRTLMLLWFVAAACPVAAEAPKTQRHAFFVTGDPQYLAEQSIQPQNLNPLSEEANRRFIELARQLPGSPLPESMGGGTVAKNILGMIIAGDLIDSLDKNGGPYPAMQRFEWNRFLADYGLSGKDGKVPFPVYELHGNHDGPQGDTFLTDHIIARNKKRPAVVNISPNGLHYSWDWGPLHLINTGLFVGAGETRREGHHYAPRGSLEFLRADLAEHVGDNGRPVIVSHHLHLTAPEFDWPAEDLAAYHNAIKPYNVIAIFNGHTHGMRHARWDGKQVSPKIEGIDNWDPDDSAAAKLYRGKIHGVGHGLLYVELIDAPGTQNDRLEVRALVTRDNWANRQWDKRWTKKVSIPKR